MTIPTIRKFVPLAATLALVAAGIGTAGAAKAPGLKPFNATYEVSYMGLGGTATMALAPLEGDRWRYSLEIGSAVATLSQDTTFEANGGNWRPLSNNDTTSLLIKKNSRTARYDWGKREARWSGDVKPERAGPVALKDGDLDAMLVNLAIPRDLAAGKPLHYRMVDNGRARDLEYTVAGTETVQVGGKPQQATKVSRRNGDKEQIVWVVEGLPVPARILQREDGEDEMDLKLKSIR
ncbi:MAG: DUF3108 domain-containing protein [Pseudomonadota bacterium]|nr:DUF3108 domain-containing protein [Pseudomonadota bacterium]